MNRTSYEICPYNHVEPKLKYNVANYKHANFCIDVRIKTQNLLGFFQLSYIEKRSSFEDCCAIQQQHIELCWYCGKQKKTNFKFHLLMTVNTQSHFDILECICRKMENSNLTMTFGSSFSNCRKTSVNSRKNYFNINRRFLL